jgi:tetrahydromethanopterin S-methyltransferase subunit A
MLKVPTHPDYPPEHGRFIRGNDYSPVAVAIVLNRDEDKIPPDIEEMVRAGARSGAALSGTIQTPNIGFELMISNIVANPNIRFLVLSGPESEGHRTGEALVCLFLRGVDEKKKVIGTSALHAVLYNLAMEFIDRFRKQVTLVDLLCRGTPDTIGRAVRCCMQEQPVEFEGYTLFDPGAFPEAPLAGRITDRILEPWNLPASDREKNAVDKMKNLIDMLKNRNK